MDSDSSGDNGDTNKLTCIYNGIPMLFFRAQVCLFASKFKIIKLY